MTLIKYKRLIFLLAILGLSAGLLWYIQTNDEIYKADVADTVQIIGGFFGGHPEAYDRAQKYLVLLKGGGTQQDPYIIATDMDLINLANAVNLGAKTFEGEHFLLTANIDLTHHLKSKDSGLGWKPIGKNYIHPFSGIFDGGGHTISGFYSGYNDPFLGLFGHAVDAQLRNLHITMPEGKHIDAPFAAGVLVGFIGGEHSIVENCTAIGDIIVTENRDSSSSAGGLIGLSNGCSIVNSRAWVNVTVYGGGRKGVEAGGLVGAVYDADIINCHAYGDVAIYPREGFDDEGLFLRVGGLVGLYYNKDPAVKLTHSSAHGTVVVKSSDKQNNIIAGGLVGDFIASNDSRILYCHASGDVFAHSFDPHDPNITLDKSQFVSAGGLTGRIFGGEVANSYALGQVSADGGEESNLGGLSGVVTRDGQIYRCYAVGLVWHSDNALSASEGGLVGYIFDSEIKNSFFDRESTQQRYATPGLGFDESLDDYPGLYSRTTREMQTQATFEGWCFEDVWRMPAGGGYPVLRSNP